MRKPACRHGALGAANAASGMQGKGTVVNSVPARADTEDERTQRPAFRMCVVKGLKDLRRITAAKCYLISAASLEQVYVTPSKPVRLKRPPLPIDPDRITSGFTGRLNTAKLRFRLPRGSGSAVQPWEDTSSSYVSDSTSSIV